MRLWRGVFLLALLAFTSSIAEEQDAQSPEEHAVASPAGPSFPRSRLRPRLLRPTTAAPALAEEELEAEKESVPAPSPPPPPPPPPKNHPRPRGKPRTTKPVATHAEEELEITTPSVPSSSRRSRNRNRNKSRNRSNSRTTTASPDTASEVTSTRSGGKRRGGSNRRTTTARVTTHAPSTSSSAPNRGNRNRNKNNGNPSGNRARGGKSKSTTTAAPTETRQGTRSRSQNTKTQTNPPRRTTTRKATTTTTPRTPPPTTMRTTTPLPETIPDIEAVPPIPIQRNPSLTRLSPSVGLGPDVDTQDMFDKGSKSHDLQEPVQEEVFVPAAKSQPQLSSFDKSERPVGLVKPRRPLPVEGLVVEDPMEDERAIPISDPSKSGNRFKPLPLEREESNIPGNFPKSKLDIEAPGVPPKLIGPISSRDLTTLKPLIDLSEDEKPLKALPARPLKPLRGEEEMAEKDVLDEMGNKELLIPDRSTGVPPKPIGLVTFRPRRPEGSIQNSKVSLEDQPPRKAGDEFRPPSKIPQPDPSENENGEWVFDPTIRPNLISNPGSLRSNNRQNSFQERPLKALPRDEITRKVDATTTVPTTRATRPPSNANRVVTPFPVRIPPPVEKIEDAEEIAVKNTRSSRLPSRNIPSPFEEDELEVPSNRRSTSAWNQPRNQDVSSKTSKNTEKSKNRFSPPATKEPVSTTTRATTLALQLLTADDEAEEIAQPPTRPPRDRSDVLLGTIPVGTGPPPRENGRTLPDNEGFIPLRVKLTFEDDSETENTKQIPQKGFDAPQQRPPLKQVDNPLNSPRAIADARPKDVSIPIDEDPLVVPPAEIARRMQPPKPKMTTEIAWSKPVMAEDEEVVTTRPTAHNERVFVPPTENSRFLSNRHEQDSFSNPGFRPASGFPIPETPVGEVDNSPRQRDMPKSGFEEETDIATAPKSSGRFSDPAKKTDSEAMNQKLGQFESPSFVIRKPVNYITPPPRAGSKTQGNAELEDIESLETPPKRRNNVKVADAAEIPPSVDVGTPEKSTGKLVPSPVVPQTLPPRVEAEPMVSEPKVPPKSRVLVTKAPPANEEYEEYYDDE